VKNPESGSTRILTGSGGPAPSSHQICAGLGAERVSGEGRCESLAEGLIVVRVHRRQDGNLRGPTRMTRITGAPAIPTPGAIT
jgi:hypothetical protein